MYVFFDTETTGLPIDWQASVSDLNNWPRVVQVAWACYDAKNRHLDTMSFIVKPDGFSIPRELSGFTASPRRRRSRSESL